jgi:hypothetical protein
MNGDPSQSEKDRRRAEAAQRIQETYGSLQVPAESSGGTKAIKSKQGNGCSVGCAVIGAAVLSIGFLWLLIGGIRYMWEHSPF